jgi:hypothetical protein
MAVLVGGVALTPPGAKILDLSIGSEMEPTRAFPLRTAADIGS